MNWTPGQSEYRVGAGSFLKPHTPRCGVSLGQLILSAFLLLNLLLCCGPVTQKGVTGNPQRSLTSPVLAPFLHSVVFRIQFKKLVITLKARNALCAG